MFCIQCGKPLPDGAKFCAFCGKPQSARSLPDGMDDLFAGLPNNHPAGSMDDLFSDVMPLDDPGVFGCSERQNNLVYAPGCGVYFIYDNNLFFYSEQNKKLRQLTKLHYNILNGLNYWDGEVFFWRWKDCHGTDLFAIKAGTNEKRIVKIQPAPGQKEGITPGIESYNHFYIRDGVGYGTATWYNVCYLYVLDMATGQYWLKDLPDTRTRDFPDDWKRDSMITRYMENHPEEKNYGICWMGLYVQGRYGYTSIQGYMVPVVRFLLEDPSQFTYMPIESGGIYKEDVISFYDGGPDGRRFLIGNNPIGGSKDNLIHITEFLPGDVMNPWEPLDMQIHKSGWERSDGYHGWWRAGDCYVIQNRMLDMKNMKLSLLPFSICADDFLEANGGIYLLSWKRLYFLPQNFSQVVRNDDDLNHFLLAKIPDRD